jgi:hypothetical protein
MLNAVERDDKPRRESSKRLYFTIFEDRSI